MIPPGNLFVIAAPSGTGKTSLVQALVDRTTGLTVSISHTTRPKRYSEEDGINYHFINEKQFKGMIERKEFLEHAIVFHHYYGTAQAWVKETLAKGLDVILEIDWQGCQQIQSLFPDCISIFILPPSLAALEERLKKRNQDKPAIIQARLKDATETITHIHEYQYLIINADFDQAVCELQHIVLASRLLRKRQVLKLPYY